MSENGITFEIISENSTQLVTGESKVDPILLPEEIPAWLTERFVQDILRQHYRDQSLKVKSLAVKQCGGKGDSYASLMFRVGTFFTNRKHPENVQFASYIVKTLPVLEIAVEKLGSDNYNVQNKEMEIYQQLLPEFRQVLESINEDPNIFPGVVAVDTKLDVIMLEDLAEQQFVMADRLKGLDRNHLQLALTKLARMHAASVIIHDKNPKAFAHLDTGFFTRKTDVFHVMFESLCDAMMEEVATWEGYEYYAQKLKKVRRNLIANAQRSFDCDDGDFHVLNHGDLW